MMETINSDKTYRFLIVGLYSLNFLHKNLLKIPFSYDYFKRKFIISDKFL